MTATMKQELSRLLDFTEGINEEFHDPDMEGIEKAWVVGNYLDNAFGNRVYEQSVMFGHQEMVLFIERRESEDDTIVESFNLATLIALARKAREDTREDSIEQEKNVATNKPYRILWDYGREGWGFGSQLFANATDALSVAQKDARVPFVIVKLVNFEEQ